MNVLEGLRRKQGMTDTEAAIADCILSHPDDVTRMTIGELAKLACCSNSAIVRLCQKLELDGYRSLRVELAKALERQRTSVLEVNPDRPFIEGNTTREITNAIATLTKQAIDATYANLNMADIRKAARLVLGARHVVYYAMGDSLASVEVFAALLVKLGIVCTSGFLRSDFGSLGQMLDTRDLAIIVTHSGFLFRTLEPVITMLRSKGCKTLVITSDLDSKSRLLGTDCMITLPQGESRSQRLATFYSQACVRYVLNCIYAEAFSMNYQENVEHWSELYRQMEESVE